MFNLFKNDKTSITDEIILLMIILFFFMLGISALFIKKLVPFAETCVMMFGVLMILVSFMLLPSLIYRLLNNNKRRGGKC